ncbi:aminodeoxychorismate synthase component I [Bacillus fonticola]|uniref:aminodeoxychorismate synthase component I n=1 Tax=Bacillus fonticola TaxID=2728853 RepID=UPI0014729918|nr:aminodeoxychorismate synthase component I [Bacillus fonticola]
MQQNSVDIQFRFEARDGTVREQPLLFRNPIRILEARTIEEVHQTLKEAQCAWEEGYYVVGYLAYEAAPAFDPAFTVHNGYDGPLAWFSVFERPEEYDEHKRGSFTVSEWVPQTSRKDFDQAIDAVRSGIVRGETYQTNYTIRLKGTLTGDAHTYFEALQQRQKGPYSAYIHTGKRVLCSASPELFFRWDGKTIVTRPMKGTAPRGKTMREDEENRAALQQSEKEQAENVMIVDLLRNDIGRIAELGSVQVPQLLTVETYPTVFQMTSTVEAKTREDVKLIDVLGALFPCGSITGAPKVSTMNYIHDLESSARGVYCGAIGYMEPGGEAVFSVPIRTVEVDVETGSAVYGVGGGITWDSKATSEYEEVLNKSQILINSTSEWSLLETMRADNGKVIYLQKHLDRMEASAHYFGYPFNQAHVKQTIEEIAKEDDCQSYKLRALLSSDGELTVEKSLYTHDNEVKTVRLATTPVDRNHLFLQHKTTHRDVYEQHQRAHLDVFDVLLWNEDGELTEFTLGNVVLEINGKRYTPPLTSGLLAGTFREFLLETEQLHDRVLRKEDLERAERVWLINSVREWVEVEFI